MCEGVQQHRSPVLCDAGAPPLSCAEAGRPPAREPPLASENDRRGPVRDPFARTADLHNSSTIESATLVRCAVYALAFEPTGERTQATTGVFTMLAPQSHQESSCCEHSRSVGASHSMQAQMPHRLLMPDGERSKADLAMAAVPTARAALFATVPNLHRSDAVGVC